MKWDSLAQGIGLVCLSIGISFALWFAFFHNTGSQQTDCDVLAITLTSPSKDGEDERDKDKIRDILVKASYEMGSDDNAEELVGIMIFKDDFKCSIYEEKDTNEMKRCFKKTLGFSEGDTIKCYYLRDDPETISVHPLSSSTFRRWCFFILVLLGLCVPCCFIMGGALSAVGLFEVQISFFEKMRCDNPSMRVVPGVTLPSTYLSAPRESQSLLSSSFESLIEMGFGKNRDDEKLL